MNYVSKLLKICYLAGYYGFASKLPSSIYPGGRYYNFIRLFLLRKIIRIGSNVTIQKGVYVGDGNNVEIGNNCQINEFVRLDNVSIGDNVMVAREVIILGKMHSFDRVDTCMVTQGYKLTLISVIENDVWLGLRVIVMPGKRIASGCIIAAGAVVTKDTRSFGIYAGVPARIIKSRKASSEIVAQILPVSKD